MTIEVSVDFRTTINGRTFQMIRILHKLLGKSAPPMPHDARLARLGESKIFVIAATQSEGIDASGLTKENLLVAIREALERDRESQKSGYSLFVHSVDGKRRLPFFTSNEHAQRFCATYSKERGRVFPFMVLEANGTFLGKIHQSSCDVVVMNDKSPDERVISDSEMAAARRMWA